MTQDIEERSVTDAEQLIAQAREIHAKAMNRSDLADEGAWVARETVNGLPPNNYWSVTATRTPTTKGVEPFTVWKAHAASPSVAGLLTFVSTALPQLCDLAERLRVDRDAAVSAWEQLTEDPVGAAERDVGRWVYERISKLMDAKENTPEAAELMWLATIVESIEEYGSIHCDGEELAPFPADRGALTPDIDHKARAQHFHRRAQRAESVAQMHAGRASFWMDRCQAVMRNGRTLRKRIQRMRGQLAQARAGSETSLERIIRLGRLFP